MALVAKKIMWWQSVQDAVSYNVRVVPNGTAFSYGAKAQMSVAHDAGKAEHEADLAGVELAEGTYDIFITAVDGGGNESDPFGLEDAVLDFTPPKAPAAGGFR